MASLSRTIGAAAAGLLAAALAVGPPPPAAAQETAANETALVETEVVFHSGDREVGATVIAPEGAQGLPGVVLVAGSGPGPGRDRYRANAEAFAEAGIVAMIYDKRGTGEGYTQFEGSFADLADDANAAVQALRVRPEVDPALVGLHGHSEGAWTVIEAAARSEAAAFVITSGGSGLTPEDTQAWMNRNGLVDAGVGEGLAAALGDRMIAALAADGLFRLAGYDPVPALSGLDRPFLGVFAEFDLNTPPGRTMELYEAALQGNDNYALRLIPGVDHGMAPTVDGTTAPGHDEDAIDPRYVETVADWVLGLAAGESGVVVDAIPVEAVPPGPVAAAPWFGTATALLAALGLFGVLFLAYPAAALVAKASGRGPLAATWASRTVAAIGLLLPVLAACYSAWVLMSGGQEPLGPVVAGRPLPWLVLQAAAVAMLAAAVVLGVQWRRRRKELGAGSKLRFSALLIGAALMVPWGVYWGLAA
ncbi:alpha/beta hydrolase family protein [Glycomyces mayteni]|uniref:Alpha/beta hydrolase family protein n=1 Tax=Glycomyces mayteni TaxID=543887 RepID=A0ABW2D6B8_9ACTN|nr:alpha/beta hydrolase [Glycomyces mayteni]